MTRARLLTRTRQITEYSCGASALQSVLHYWGQDVDEKELMRLIGTDEDVGTHPENIARGVRELRLQTELRDMLTLDEVAQFTADVGSMIALGQVWRSQKSAFGLYWYVWRKTQRRSQNQPRHEDRAATWMSDTRALVDEVEQRICLGEVRHHLHQAHQRGFRQLAARRPRLAQHRDTTAVDTVGTRDAALITQRAQQFAVSAVVGQHTTDQPRLVHGRRGGFHGLPSWRCARWRTSRGT